MAAYFTSGGAGTDVQGGGTDGLQTLYLMNPNYVGVGYADAAPAAANMMLFNSAVGSLAPASFGHHQPAQHLVGIPLQPPHSESYNLWAPAAAAADMSPRLQQQGGPGTSAVSAVLSLSSREATPVTVASVPCTTEGTMYMGASRQEQVLMSSRYLKPAQALLDDAVSVSTGLEEATAAAKSAAAVKKMEDPEAASRGGAEDGTGGKSSGAAELSTTERQDLQMKKNKLVNMLDEVDQRYRQYHQQMQAVAAAFEAAAGGTGSARTYTALALSTISWRFRCLRDTIAAQVRSASRVLGEEEDGGCGGRRRTVGSRLRLIDRHLRQQRALQQLGMMDSGAGGGGAWRPQRGLPEHSVSVLRAWLFEHFLHPYPKDSDKVMLARQTGLTRGQVSNWFINARVRLWKPMVEEMYMEETKGRVDDDDGGGDGGSGSSRMSKSTAVDSARHGNGVPPSSSKLQVVDHVNPAASTTLVPGDQHRLKKTRTTDEPAAAFHVSDDVAALEEAAQAAARREEEVSHRELLMKFMEAGGDSGERDSSHQDGVGGYSMFTPAPYGQFGSEEQFAFAGNGSGVSLTLGRGSASNTEHPNSFLMGGSSSASDGAVAAGYDMNMQNTKSLAAQLMRDFVAHN